MERQSSAIRCRCGTLAIDDVTINYSYKDYFPKDVHAAVEEMVAQADAEMEYLLNRFRGC